MARAPSKPPVPVTPAIIDRVEQLLLEGHNLTEISAMPGMPRRSSISYRVDSDPTLSARIARAREIGWDVRAEKAVMDAKAATDPQKGKLAFDADRWLLSKMNSAKYQRAERWATGDQRHRARIEIGKSDQPRGAAQRG